MESGSGSPRDFTRIPDSDLHRMPVPDLHSIIRRLEQDKLNSIADHGNLMRDVNKRLQIHLVEIRNLKDVNQRLQDDNQELRDLCCFLDDDRQKSRKLAREWQRFGRYTSSVMKSEVSAYQEKLNELESRQNDLVKENVELKELCLYLDEERNSALKNNSVDDRDQGDGSSIASFTNERLDEVASGDEETSEKTEKKTTSKNMTSTSGTLGSVEERPSINDHTSQYIQQLENHIKTLEDQLSQMDVRLPSKENKDWQSQSPFPPRATPSPQSDLMGAGGAMKPSPNKPEAIVHAMRSLDVREQLEQINDGHYDDGLNDVEKAVLRQMSKIAKKRLNKSQSSPNTTNTTKQNSVEVWRDSPVADSTASYNGPMKMESGHMKTDPRPMKMEPMNPAQMRTESMKIQDSGPIDSKIVTTTRPTVVQEAHRYPQAEYYPEPSRIPEHRPKPPEPTRPMEPRYHHQPRFYNEHKEQSQRGYDPRDQRTYNEQRQNQNPPPPARYASGGYGGAQPQQQPDRIYDTRGWAGITGINGPVHRT